MIGVGVDDTMVGAAVGEWLRGPSLRDDWAKRVKRRSLEVEDDAIVGYALAR